jgi:hypothetical protein
MYTQYTQDSLVAAISTAMGDPTNLYWLQDEIARAINEALLYWGALTAYWRDRGTFSTTPSTPFYDLSAQLPALRARTYAVDDITREVQYALFELSTGVPGTGLTLQFTPAQITSAVMQAADQFGIDCTLPLNFSNFDIGTAPPDGRMALDQTIVAVSRVAFRDVTTGIWTILRREDEWSAQSIMPQWNLNPGTPQAYAMADAPPLVLQMLPAPVNSGTIHILFSEALPLTPTGPTSLLYIPNEFVLSIKWYALYLLLNSYNEGYDPYRAKYALERYRQVVATTDSMCSVNRIQVNGQLLPLDTIWNLDAAVPWWMNTTGLPAYAASTADVICLVPMAGASPCSVLCDVVCSAPLPVLGTDYIQLGREEIPYIIDYVCHILSFKIGGTEFGSTFGLYDNFLAGARQRNQLLSTRVRYLTSLFEQAELNEELMPTA